VQPTIELWAATWLSDFSLVAGHNTRFSPSLVKNNSAVTEARMAKLDHLQQLHRLLKSHRRPVPLATLAQRLECSERTVRRLIDEMKTWFDAPLEYDKVQNGWHYQTDGDEFEIPGLWLTSAELQSLTLLLHVLENFGNGLLNEELSTVEKQIHHFLKARHINPGAFTERIKILPQTSRYIPGKIFQQVGDALLQRRQLEIAYKSFSHQQSLRGISPQTLVYYRENWYLDAWCHLRNDLRTFSLARITSISVSQTKALDIDNSKLQQHFADSYGIFAGKAKHTARLRFLPRIAREIAQQSSPHAWGCFLIERVQINVGKVIPTCMGMNLKVAS
jgi:proteasome accessory factor C